MVLPGSIHNFNVEHGQISQLFLASSKSRIGLFFYKLFNLQYDMYDFLLAM